MVASLALNQIVKVRFLVEALSIGKGSMKKILKFLFGWMALPKRRDKIPQDFRDAMAKIEQGEDREYILFDLDGRECHRGKSFRKFMFEGD
jgi:hypothetical protein